MHKRFAASGHPKDKFEFNALWDSHGLQRSLVREGYACESNIPLGRIGFRISCGDWPSVLPI